MKSNYTIVSNTPIVVYEVSSKGIRHIRTTLPPQRDKDAPKPSKDADKRDKSD